MYFGQWIILEKDNINYENPAGRKVVQIDTNWDDTPELAEIQAGDAIDVELKILWKLSMKRRINYY